jgi:hypothetical protein
MAWCAPYAVVFSILGNFIWPARAMQLGRCGGLHYLSQIDIKVAWYLIAGFP